MAGYIIINDDKGADGLRMNMRRTMMRGGSSAMMNDGHHSTSEAYKMGYRHGWEDSDDMALRHGDEYDLMDFRRMRDSRGRFV